MGFKRKEKEEKEKGKQAKEMIRGHKKDRQSEVHLKLFFSLKIRLSLCLPQEESKIFLSQNFSVNFSRHNNNRRRMRIKERNERADLQREKSSEKREKDTFSVYFFHDRVHHQRNKRLHVISQVRQEEVTRRKEGNKKYNQRWWKRCWSPLISSFHSMASPLPSPSLFSHSWTLHHPHFMFYIPVHLTIERKKWKHVCALNFTIIIYCSSIPSLGCFSRVVSQG